MQLSWFLLTEYLCIAWHYLCGSSGTVLSHKGKGLPQKAEVTEGVPGRLMLRIFLTFGTTRIGRSSALRTGRLYPRRNPWYLFLKAESTPGHMVLSVAREKIPSDTTGIRSRDRSTSSAVP